MSNYCSNRTKWPVTSDSKTKGHILAITEAPFFPGALQYVVLTKVKASPIQGTFQDDRGFTPDHTPMSAKKRFHTRPHTHVSQEEGSAGM